MWKWLDTKSDSCIGYYHLEFDPMRASTYHELPEWIRDKHAVINVRNDDAYCFEWSVLAGLHESTNRGYKNLTSSYTTYERRYMK